MWLRAIKSRCTLFSQVPHGAEVDHPLHARHLAQSTSREQELFSRPPFRVILCFVYFPQSLLFVCPKRKRNFFTAKGLLSFGSRRDRVFLRAPHVVLFAAPCKSLLTAPVFLHNVVSDRKALIEAGPCGGMLPSHELIVVPLCTSTVTTCCCYLPSCSYA